MTVFGILYARYGTGLTVRQGMRDPCINISGLMKCLTLVLAVCLLLASPTSKDSSAQDTPPGPAGMRAPIVLNDDDVPAFPEPPEGIDVQREGEGLTLVEL